MTDIPTTYNPRGKRYELPSLGQWLKRCGEELKRIAKINDVWAEETAKIILENLNSDLRETPEDAAREEVDNWPND